MKKLCPKCSVGRMAYDVVLMWDQCDTCREYSNVKEEERSRLTSVKREEIMEKLCNSELANLTNATM